MIDWDEQHKVYRNIHIPSLIILEGDFINTTNTTIPPTDRCEGAQMWWKPIKHHFKISLRRLRFCGRVQCCIVSDQGFLTEIQLYTWILDGGPDKIQKWQPYRYFYIKNLRTLTGRTVCRSWIKPKSLKNCRPVVKTHGIANVMGGVTKWKKGERNVGNSYVVRLLVKVTLTKVQ